MIKVKKVISKAEKFNYFYKSFDFKTHTLLVTDLESKKYIQSKLLEKRKSLVGSKIFRAVDLWQIIFSQINPDWQIISNQTMMIYIDSFIREKGMEGLSVADCLVGLRQILPLILHPQYQEALDEYQKNRGEWSRLWIEKLKKIREIWRIIFEQKITISSWISAQLLYEKDIHKYFGEKIFVDLSFDLQHVEAEILQSISSYVEVESFSLEPEPAKLAALEYATVVEEIKGAVKHIRQLLESGIKPNSIHVLIPDLESYWPIAKTIFKSEGIPYAKKNIGLYAEDIFIKKWVSDIKIKFNYASKDDFEISTFTTDSSPSIDEKIFFQHYQKNIDLNLQDPLGLVKRSDLVDKKISVDKFIDLILAVVPERLDKSRVDKIILNLLNEVPKSHFFLPQMWIMYLDLLINRFEFNIDDSMYAENGVRVTNILGGEWADSEYRFYLGLSEENLKIYKQAVFPADELMRISSLYGFPVEPDKTYDMSLYLRDIDCSKTFLSFSRHSVRGDVHVPSQMLTTIEKISGVTRRSCIDITSELSENNFFIFPQIISLSPSTIEKYYDCPGKVYFSKILSLYEKRSIDIEPDPLQKGTLNHKICEKLMECDLNLDERYRESFLHQCLTETKSSWDKQFINEILSRSLDFINRFISFEKEQKKLFPKRKNVANEFEFEIFYSPISNSLLTAKSHENDFIIRGKIDRIDIDHQGNALIIDYKSNTSGMKKVSDWIAEGNWQLLMYAYFIEKNLIKIPGAKYVAGAVYYSLKDFDMGNGFLVVDKISSLCEAPSMRSQMSMTEDSKKVMYEKFEIEFFGILKQIAVGQYMPSPRDIESCKYCEWRPGCRANHLL